MPTFSQIIRSNVRNYAVCMCLLYMLLVMMFHSNLNSGDPRHTDKQDKGLVPVKKNTEQNASDIEYMGREFHRNGRNSTDNNVSQPQCVGGYHEIEESFEFVEVGVKLYVFSVYWDQRINDFDNINGNAYLRIITLISTYVAKQKKELYCLFIDPWSNITIPVLAHYYEMCENHGCTYGGYILSCRVPLEIYNPKDKKKGSAPLCSVKLSPSQVLNDPLARDFKVVNTEPSGHYKHRFSICTAPLYGSVPRQVKLIEFIELSMLLGASHFTFYNYDIRDNVVRLMEYYHRLGRVTLIPWSLPQAVLDNPKLVWYNGQSIAILDCLFRNMATSQFVAFNDIDEYMIPYGNFTDWHDMIDAVDKDENCAYQMNSAFFDPKYRKRLDPGDISSDLITITHTHRTTHSSHIRTKCMVKPYKMFEAGIHHVSKPIIAELQTVRLDLPVALLHHYRTCQPNYGMNCKEFEDSHIIPERYGQQLLKRVVHNLKQFANYLDTNLEL